MKNKQNLDINDVAKKVNLQLTSLSWLFTWGSKT